jgi:hypothetical protein
MKKLIDAAVIPGARTLPSVPRIRQTTSHAI